MRNSVLMFFLNLILIFCLQHHQDVDGQGFRRGHDERNHFINSYNDHAEFVRKMYSGIKNDWKRNDVHADVNSNSDNNVFWSLDEGKSWFASAWYYIFGGVVATTILYVVLRILSAICCISKGSDRPSPEERLVRYNQQHTTTTSTTQNTSLANGPMPVHVEVPVTINNSTPLPLPVMNSFGIPGRSPGVSGDHLPPSYDQLYPGLKNYNKV